MSSAPVAVDSERSEDDKTGPNQSVMSRAATAPSTASTALSARSCRASRPRSAPSARRTAISRLRCTARASSRLATLAHAMSSTSPHVAASQTESFASLVTLGPRASWTEPSDTVPVESPV